MRISIEEIIDRIEQRYDADSVVDILGLSVRELLEAFPDKMLDRLDEFYGVDLDDA